MGPEDNPADDEEIDREQYAEYEMRVHQRKVAWVGNCPQVTNLARELKGDTPDLRAWNLPIAIDGIEIRKHDPSDSEDGPVEVFAWFNGVCAKIYSEKVNGTLVGHHITAGGIRAALVRDNTAVKVSDAPSSSRL